MNTATLDSLLAAMRERPDDHELRGVMSDALADFGQPADLESAYALGCGDGATAARESGSADGGEDGWDGWLIAGVGSDGACRLFGLEPEEGGEDGELIWQHDNGGTPAWVACLLCYAAGAQTGALRSLVTVGE
jgi:hypothetical protein